MTKVTRFHPSHFGAIRLDRRFQELADRVTPEYLAALAAESAITIWCDGAPVVCGGVVGSCEVWAAFDAQRAQRHTLAIVRVIRRYLSTFGFLYTNVERPFDCKLPENLLGFVERQGHRVKRGERIYIHLERAA